MKDVKILRMEIRNFKGQRKLDLDFGGLSRVIYGDNATGKTTVYDAFTWVLFGVDSLGQTAFDIKPLNQDGQVADHAAITSVEADLLVDGKHRNLKRTHYEKWSKKRGSANETFDGNTSDFFLDDVPVKKNLFDTAVKEMVGDEKMFRTLTDLRRFSVGLSWKDRRKLLMDMCWNTTDQDVMQQEERFSPLLEEMGERSLDDYKAMLTAKRKNLSGTRDKIPTRLDELNRMVEQIPACDYDSVRAELEEEKQRLNSLLSMASDGGKSAELERQLQKLSGLEDQRRMLERSNLAYRSKFPRPDVARLERAVREAENDQRLLRDNIENEKLVIDSYEADLDALRKEWAACNKAEFAGGTCPTCGQPLPEDQLQEAEKAFSAWKAKELASIEERAAKRKQTISSEKEHVASLTKSMEDCAERLEQARKALEDGKAEAAEPIPDLPNYQEQKADLDRQYQACADSIVELQMAEQKDDSQKKAELVRAEIRRLESRLADERTVQNAQRRKAELEEERDKASIALEELDNLIFLCEEFIRYKVQLIDDTVSGYFRVVRFKLFREQVNGGLAECCEATVNGIPYASLNNGAKINAGIDIVRTLSDYYGVKVPLFIDNAESVTEIMDADTQVICLSVSEPDKELRLA